MALTPRVAELPNGVGLAYVEQGDPSGVPMVLLHGYTDSWRSFESVLPHLPPNIRAFAVSQRGHGDSDRPATGYSTRQFAADIADFVDVLDLGPVVVVGHSMGSTHAMRFGLDYPELSLGLVFAGSFLSYRNNPVIIDFWENGVSKLEDPIDPAFVREFQEGTLHQPISRDFLEAAIQESLRLPAAVWRAAFEGFLADHFTNELGRINAPSLIVWGDQDALCPRADQEALLEIIPGAELLVYEGVGHALHWEQPQRFANDIAAFAQRAARRGLEQRNPSSSASPHHTVA